MSRVIISTLACSVVSGVVFALLYLATRPRRVKKTPRKARPMRSWDPRFILAVVWSWVSPKPRPRTSGRHRNRAVTARHALEER